MQRFLIVEDDLDAASSVVNNFRALGYMAQWSRNGAEAMQRVTNDAWDLIILDRMLPDGVDGLSILASMRTAGSRTPVLVLSALDAWEEKVRCLKAGCDDYLIKPFAFPELEARAQALVRRSQPASPERVLHLADLKVDLSNQSVERGGRPIVLKPREFQLLSYLMMNQAQVFTRAMLLEAVWGYRFDPQTNLVEAQISRLRGKIDAGGARPLIHTVRGQGYCMTAKG